MKKYILLSGFILTAVVFPYSSVSQTASDSIMNQLFQMSLDQLLGIEVLSASNTPEKLNKAPATVIVITREDIAERGYIEMYDILNDLPGFDLSRAHGDDDYVVYTRGYRKTTSDQILYMIDGRVMNHLYSNNMHLFAQYPLQNIKQIEIVYGPASVIYGANAFSGVIHIITDNEPKNVVYLSAGQNNTLMSEVHFVNEIKYLKLGINGRFYQSDGPDLEGRTPYLSNKIYNDSMVWGPFIHSDFAGYFSPIYAHYLDGFINIGKFTFGGMNWFHEANYGCVHPADKALNHVPWQFMEQSVYVTHETSIGSLNSKSMLRYRVSGHPGTSMFITTEANGMVNASYWQTTNRSFTYCHDFSYPFSDKLFMNFGLKAERRQLQKAYDTICGPSLPGDSVVLYPFEAILPLYQSFAAYNHFFSTDLGTYCQVRWSLHDIIDIIGGARYDYNSIYKSVLSPRIGLIAERNGFNLKAFYGRAFLEPTPRSLYGGWVGSLSNKNLKPEYMNTFEATFGYSQKNISNSVTFFFNQCTDAIGSVNSIPVNVGERRMAGIEFYSRSVFHQPVSWLKKIKTDLFISYIQSKEDLSDNGMLGYEPTGNMAPYKVHFIFTAYLNKCLSLSLQDRWLSRTETVKTNPIRHIEAYNVCDFFIECKPISNQQFSVGLKIYNIFNVSYFHPGYREANAGENAFDNSGNLIPSAGWYNSRLPQPYRTFQLVCKLNI